MADHFAGKRLNSPNDVIVQSDGTVWFSDPPYGIQTDYEGGKQEQEQLARVYRWDPRTGALSVAADDIDGPNGLCFSPENDAFISSRLESCLRTIRPGTSAPSTSTRTARCETAGYSIR